MLLYTNNRLSPCKSEGVFMYISNPVLDSLILEDVPYMDLTTHVLGITDIEGEMEYFTREDCVLCCVEEGITIMKKLGLEVADSKKSGHAAKAGESFLLVRGSAEKLHSAWKVCLNLFDFYSAMATKTRRLVDIVEAANDKVSVLTTRKSIPGTKPFTVKAILTGGAFPHRLGLSDTILIFDHHLEFFNGIENLIDTLPSIKSKCCEKKIIVEAGIEDAYALACAGVDGIQFDKVAAKELSEAIPLLRKVNSHMTLLAAGGINESNAAEYAMTGVDGLVTTCLFHVKPVDMSVHMRKL
jgi:molybdenum transport protein